ncbi:DNA-binding transcriptional LysR family regulator [Micromonospora luteifusca]|uniref:DNA-binding transcriptional LysR family regulator n=1 Tax=Micromonospora luteifusca TaxID=709860 RepID=A0ABS2M0S8_9ACTN|nr:LysR family transcriptional regulator [Micromonospora luteifusca]MBM7494055.1 DNA-binding transcriptional LysR family regulator [Micromonospora luteifusca]
MLDRTEAEVLLTLAKELHFGRTAEQLRLTPGQVSRIVQRLERRIGTTLFTRTSRVVTLTPIGADLVQELAPHLTGIEAAVRRAVEAGRGVTGTLRTAFLGAAAGQLLLKAVALFGIRHPDCEVHIHEAQVHDSYERVFTAAVDVLITVLPARGVQVGPVLLAEPQLLAVPRHHRLATRAEVTQDVLADHPVIQMPDTMPETTRHYRIPKMTPSGRPVLQGPAANTFPEILALVAAGKGVFPVGAHAARFYPRPDIAYIPMPDAPLVQWAPVWLKTNETGIVRAFITCAVEAAEQ